MKKLGIINFFPAFNPPRSGGELRYWHLATRLARRFDVEMLNPTFGEAAREEVHHAPCCRETRIPKSRAYNAWHHLLDRHARFRECSAFVCSRAAPGHRELAGAAHQLAARSDILMHEFPYLWRIGRRASASQILAYDAHNVEADMARDMFGDGLWGRWATSRVRALERSLAREADIVFATSDEDARRLSALHGVDLSRIMVAPNGVDIDAVRPPASAAGRIAARGRLGIAGDAPAALFIGSYHPPNIEAVELIAARLARAFREVTWLVAGKVCDAFTEVPANVRLLGLVSEEAKRDLLAGADFAINPMLSGSGTNLKMLDYLASGLPIVTTVRGARGLSLEHRRTAVVVEEARLEDGVADVLGSSTLRRTLATEGREHAERHFSWDAIAGRMADALAIKSSRRIVVLNDFPATPVDFGGRARVAAAARALASESHPVTILTLSKSSEGRHALHGPWLEEMNIPRSRAHRWMDALLANAAGVGADDVSAMAFHWLTPGFRRAIARECRGAAGLYLVHCYLVGLARGVAGGTPMLHDSLNVESALKAQLYRAGWLSRWMLGRVRHAEREAVRTARATVCVAAADREALVALHGHADRFIVAPNGVDTSCVECLPQGDRIRLRRAAGMGAEPVVLFLASGHAPNVEAARFILQSLASMLPEATFLIAGSVGAMILDLPAPPNACILQVVSPAAKDFLLQTSTLAVNPVTRGSGTNVKMLDYLASGLPAVTTAVGARGVGVGEEDGLVVCELERMGDVVREVIADAARLNRLALAARRTAVERFDWSVCLAPAVEAMERAISAGR